MCGIAGQFTHAPRTPAEVTLADMGAAMRYHSPGDEGFSVPRMWAWYIGASIVPTNRCSF
jgi:asparagine synthetase B (glutamine-hydrolysing)